jgi:hypothetical protein
MSLILVILISSLEIRILPQPKQKMPIPGPDIQKTRLFKIEVELGGVEVGKNLVFGGRVVEPDGAYVGGVGGVVGEFGRIEGVPAERVRKVNELMNRQRYGELEVRNGRRGRIGQCRAYPTSPLFPVGRVPDGWVLVVPVKPSL